MAVGEERKENIVTDRLHQRGQIVGNDLVELGHLVKANQMTVDGGMRSGRGQLEIAEGLAGIFFDSSENHFIFCHDCPSRAVLVLEVVVFLLEAIETPGGRHMGDCAKVHRLVDSVGRPTFT